MLLNSNMKESMKKAEELRKLVEDYKFTDIEKVTISLGVYEFLETDTYETITSKVDKAMYEAKNSGRNRVTEYKE